MDALLILSLLWMGILLGIYLAPLIHDHRIGDLSDVQYVAMHQMRDKTFARVMPAMGLSILALAGVSVAIAMAPGIPRQLGGLAVGLLVIDIVFTVRRQVPINRRIQAWTGSEIPVEWMQLRDMWARQHLVRLSLATLACACFAVAVLLSLSHSQGIASGFASAS